MSNSLSLEQFQKARDAGFTTEQITKFEKIRLQNKGIEEETDYEKYFKSIGDSQ